MSPLTSAGEFVHAGDLSIRLDDTSKRALRTQYRVRYRPALHMNDQWSLHGTIATGDEFESAYNTLGESDQALNLRRLFLRYTDLETRVEFGVVPPVKGFASSVGLSKEGWIRGMRVVSTRPQAQIEFVMGDLSDLSANHAFSNAWALSYLELEYSARIDERWTFELAAEEIFRDRFVRSEIRYTTGSGSIIAAEVIHNVDARDHKIVVSASRQTDWFDREIEWFTYYTYTGSGFGARADLSEDFLEIGHALATRLEGEFSTGQRLGWFVEIELYEAQTRLKAGLSIPLSLLTN
ncbi:MAG: hypothetical protein O3B72_06305 [Proteobacteria bacterium]|nr:hypothetical protein [Pseudomonadota bacterium]